MQISSNYIDEYCLYQQKGQWIPPKKLPNLLISAISGLGNWSDQQKSLPFNRSNPTMGPFNNRGGPGPRPPPHMFGRGGGRSFIIL